MSLPETKRCNRCKVTKPAAEFGTRNQDGRVYLRAYCKPCSVKNNARFRQQKPENRLYSSVKQRAGRYGLPFDLELADIVIPDKCPVLGIPLVADYTKRTDGTPSVDKIIPELGYVKGNIVIVSWRANRLKNDASLSELKALHDFYCTSSTS